METSAYERIYLASIEDPERFWTAAAADLVWAKPWQCVIDDSDAPFYRWFSGGEFNTCFNAVDRHVAAGRGEQAAIIYDSPVTGTTLRISFGELLDSVSRLAGAMAARGVTRGDRVVIYMPMIPETLISMLACARLGAVHSVVFGGFAADELAIRIDDARPKLIVSASCSIETARVIEFKPLLDEAISLSTHKPDVCIVLQRAPAKAEMTEGRDLDWNAVTRGASPHDCVPVASTDPLYILYTSGTTGRPKGVVRDNGGHAVALHWSMKHIYDVEPGDVFWTASDMGWVVGHSYIVYGPLLYGCTTVIYEGNPISTPDPGAFWRVIAEHGVKTLFTAPTAFRAIKREDPTGEYIKRCDLSNFKALFLVGERCDPDTVIWAQDRLNVPVIDHWWQTETGWPICANCLGIEEFPVRPGSPTKPVPGYDLKVLGERHNEVPSGELGALVIKLPLPPGALTTLWHADERFEQSYLSAYPGYYETGDAGYIDEDGYVYVMARSDDVIQVAGHRLPNGAIEEVMASHPDVAECAVIGIADETKGQLPVGFLVLNAGCKRDSAEITKEVVQLVRSENGPLAAFKACAVVKRLPKTRSGKVLRATMRSMAGGTDYKLPATIDTPSTLDEIAAVVDRLGLPSGR